MARRKGQSILEYIIIIVALIAAIMGVANGLFSKKINESYEHLSNEMSEGITKIDVQ